VCVVDAINQGRGVNEMLAINDHDFLVLDRDNRTNVTTPPNTAASPNLKRIYKIDLKEGDLTDVSDIESLPATSDELGSIVPVTKTLFLDLLDPEEQVKKILEGEVTSGGSELRVGPQPQSLAPATVQYAIA
jgi:Esterase-like activity of phytase